MDSILNEKIDKIIDLASKYKESINNGQNSEVNDLVGNYSQKMISLLNKFNYTNGIDEGIILFEKLINKEISFEEFKKLGVDKFKELDKEIKKIILKSNNDLEKIDTEISKYLKTYKLTK